jgi:hypothetical protein
MEKHPPASGQGQRPLASRTRPEIPEHTPDTDERQPDAVDQGVKTPDQPRGPTPMGYPSGKTAGREDEKE